MTIKSYILLDSEIHCIFAFADAYTDISWQQALMRTCFFRAQRPMARQSERGLGSGREAPKTVVKQRQQADGPMKKLQTTVGRCLMDLHNR